MPVSGLVVTLSVDDGPRAAALRELHQDPRITVGVCRQNRLAIVAETSSDSEDRQLWDRLMALPGIVHLDVTFVGFEGAAYGNTAGVNGDRKVLTHDGQ